MDDWRIERLQASHDRKPFDCGRPSLNEFPRALVGQYEKRKLGRTYVAVLPNDNRVYGYHTLAAGSVSASRLSAKAARKLPKHPVPVAVLGRLAVDRAAQGRGLGARLLIDALRRCLALSESLGLYAVVVAALDEGAKKFYLKYRFSPMLDNELHLYLPIGSVEKLAP